MLLHKLYLDSRLALQTLFSIERAMYLSSAPDVMQEQHIMVCGMPRSGTTALLEQLFATGEFGALQYKDMPFIGCPNLANAVLSRFVQKVDVVERAHADGIQVSSESPEAFDEVFFDRWDGDEFIHDYRDLVSLILRKKNKTRYLSKNNNLFRKLGLVRQSLPSAKFVCVVRDPLEASASLFAQHKNFSALQEDAQFVRVYMDMLNHREFGLGHKAWFRPQNWHDPGTYEYWLEQWILFHRNILQLLSENEECLLLVSYQKLCEIPETLDRLFLHLNLPAPRDNGFSSRPKRKPVIEQRALRRQAYEIFEEIQALCFC